MTIHEKLIANKDLVNIYAIGVMTLAISLSQLMISYYSVNSIKNKTAYDEVKTLPQIEVLRASSKEDTIRVINKGGEIFSAWGDLYTFIYVQANLSPQPPKIARYYVPNIYSRPLQPNGKMEDTILISSSNINFEERQKIERDFANQMSELGYPSSVSYYSFLKVSYRDIFYEKHEKFYRIINPGLPPYEIEDTEDIKKDLEELFLKSSKYKLIKYGENELDVAKKWLIEQHTTNKAINY